MSYLVEWTVEAENDLASCWTTLRDRSAVTVASQWLDVQLSIDPIHFGEPWASSVHRIAVQTPIGVEFEVIEDDKRVIVHGVFAVD